MAKNHGVRQTKGNFKLVGKTKGTLGDRFQTDMTFDSGRSKRGVNFGVMTSAQNETWVVMDGFDADKAIFQKYDPKTKSNSKKEVDWDDRFDFEEEGYQPMFGVRLGLEMDAKNKPVIETMFPFDAAEEVQSKLTDDMSVYVEGQIDIQSYVKDGEKKRFKNFKITKLYAQSKEVDFDAEDFKEENKFEQEIIFMSIDKEKVDNKETGRFIVSAKIVTYTSVEDVEFIVENKVIAQNFKSKLKPYTMIKVMGRLMSRVDEAEQPSEDSWGEDEDMKQGNNVKFREMVITKAYPESIDKETYTEEILDSVSRAEEEFGNTVSSNDDDDDNDVW